MKYADVIKDLEEFVNEKQENILEDIQEKKSIEISWKQLEKHDFQITDWIKQNPEDGIQAAEEAVEILPVEEKPVRFTDFPEEDLVLLKDLRSQHVNKLIPVEGMIKRASKVLMDMESAIFECVQCGDRYEKKQDQAKPKSPYKCECGSRKFDLVEKNLVDFQVIVLEETPENRTASEEPIKFKVELRGDLTTPGFQKRIVPGNTVHVNGIVKERQVSKNDTTFQMYMEANNLEPTEMEFERLEIDAEDERMIQELSKEDNVFQQLSQSIAPSIEGHEKIKEAIMLQLFSGVTKEKPGGGKLRGNIHTLLIGEPGTGKSAMLEYAGELAPKGRYVVGKSATSAGLTATVVKEEDTGDYSLEAGAVVLANKGLAAIDEIDKMNKEDRSSLHEAMEQGQISVSKANIQATLNADTSVLAAGNPVHGTFDQYEPTAKQINISSTLLSRFDMIFPVKDEADEEEDVELSNLIMENHRNARDDLDVLDQDFLMKYVGYAKRNVRPDLTEEAGEPIQEFYVNIRQQGDEDSPNVPITPRQLEAMIRLAEAHAKAHLRDEVTPEDGEKAVEMMKYCLEQVGVDPETGDYDIQSMHSDKSGSQVNRLQKVRRILKERGGEDKPVDIQEVVNECEEAGIDEQKAEKIIRNMINEGNAYEPSNGKVQFLK